jgi:hypothetical protein
VPIALLLVAARSAARPTVSRSNDQRAGCPFRGRDSWVDAQIDQGQQFEDCAVAGWYWGSQRRWRRMTMKRWLGVPVGCDSAVTALPFDELASEDEQAGTNRGRTDAAVTNGCRVGAGENRASPSSDCGVLMYHVRDRACHRPRPAAGRHCAADQYRRAGDRGRTHHRLHPPPGVSDARFGPGSDSIRVRGEGC